MATTQSNEVGGFTASERRALYRARAILDRHLPVSGIDLSAPQRVIDYLRCFLADREHEEFLVLFLNAQNQLLGAEQMFRGTLTQTSVYPREVVKAALARNAAAVIFAHNHPSGMPEPSRADELLTQNLRQALALVDVKVLDHFIVGGGRSTSFAERGLI
jgi:DNA repair protein RadC